jgi:hypothetical protein
VKNDAAALAFDMIVDIVDLAPVPNQTRLPSLVVQRQQPQPQRPEEASTESPVLDYEGPSKTSYPPENQRSNMKN